MRDVTLKVSKNANAGLAVKEFVFGISLSSKYLQINHLKGVLISMYNPLIIDAFQRTFSAQLNL